MGKFFGKLFGRSDEDYENEEFDEMGGNLVFMADKWTPKCLAGSGSLWLPILFDREGTPVIPFVTKW